MKLNKDNKKLDATADQRFAKLPSKARGNTSISYSPNTTCPDAPQNDKHDFSNSQSVARIVDEYKMSMGGCFFNNTHNKEHDIELEILAIENALESHLFDTYQLLSIYDELSDLNKREFFRRVIVEFIKFKFHENEG